MKECICEVKPGGVLRYVRNNGVAVCVMCNGSLDNTFKLPAKELQDLPNGLLSYNELSVLVEHGIITNVKPEQINATSIDLTLGDTILEEDSDAIDPWRLGQRGPQINLKARTPLAMREVKLEGIDAVYNLQPGAFVLAQSQQVFNLPPYISAEYKLKSSMARIGLEHLNAGWCDAGWNGSVLTLELKNMTRFHNIGLEAGVGIGQIVFFKHTPVPQDKSYAARGRYNNDTTVKGIKE